MQKNNPKSNDIKMSKIENNSKKTQKNQKNTAKTQKIH